MLENVREMLHMKRKLVKHFQRTVSQHVPNYISDKLISRNLCWYKYMSTGGNKYSIIYNSEQE